MHEKYLGLARDASSAGDRIAAENYYQHAEHYFRIHSLDMEERALRHPGNGQPQGPDAHRRNPGYGGNGNGNGRPGPNGMNGDEHMGAPMAPESGIELPETDGPEGSEDFDGDGDGDGDNAPQMPEARDNRRRKPVNND